MKKNNNEFELLNIDAKIKHMEVYIEGDGDLVLNKMNARTFRELMNPDRKAAKEQPNVWEDIITSIHWRDPLGVKDTYKECDEAFMNKLLKENAPCITQFGLMQSLKQAVVRNEIDTYSTKFDNAVNIIAVNGLIPVEIGGWSLDSRLMSPKRGAPISVHINHFHNWKAHFHVAYMDNVYSRDQILNVINLAGFGLGIGSGRTSGYGRYHITAVEAYTESEAA